MIDQRFKDTLEKDLKAEIKKGEDIIIADLHGQRVSRRFTEIMQVKMNEIAQITDPQVLLSSTIALLRESASVLDDVIMEANVSRREQQARAKVLKEHYSKFIQLEKQINSEKEAADNAVQEAADKASREETEQKIQEENSKNQIVRKIGERPEKIKSIRNSNDIV